MAEQKHTGSCHCGAVTYEATVDLEKPVMACNCSMCSRKGTLLTFVPTSHFDLKSGEGNLTDYTFNHNVIHHAFCKTCGVTSFARGKNPKTGDAMVAINARCLDDVDVTKLDVKHFDGKSA